MISPRDKITKAAGEGRRSVLITGASSGIGKALTVSLVDEGWRVIATVRTPSDRLELLALTGDRADVLLLDVTHFGDFPQAYEAVDRIVGKGGLHGLVNNAGIVLAGPLECISIDAIRNQFDVNVFGPLELTRTLLPLLRRAKGRIINIGSYSGQVTLPFLGPYSASKAALDKLSMALRNELAPWGIPVSLIESGSLKTEIWERTLTANRALLNKYAPDCRERYEPYLNKLEELAVFIAKSAGNPNKLVRLTQRILSSRSPRSKYIVGFDAMVFIALSRLLPIAVINAIGRAALGLAREKDSS